MKLIQIKEFNSETVTQEIAAEIASLLCWNHFNEPEYIGKFKIEDAEPIGVLKGGGGSKSPWREGDEKKYDKTSHGITIYNPHHSRIRIFRCGNAIGSYEKNCGEYDTLRRHRPSGKERLIRNEISHNNQVKLTQLYLDHGFYKID